MSENLSSISSKKFTLYPLFWLAVCFAGGIAAAKFSPLVWQIYAAVCLSAAALAVIFLKRRFVPVFLFAAFAAAGALFFQLENQNVSADRLKRIYDENRIISNEPVEVEGVLRNEPELAVGGFFLNLRAEKIVYKNAETEVSGNIRLFAVAASEPAKDDYRQLDLGYGSRIRVGCRLRRENAFLNAGVILQTEIFDQQEIDAAATIKSPLLIENLGETKTFAPLAWIYERRRDLTVDFRDNFKISTAGVLIASLLGNDNFLDKRTAEIFRDGGTFHVLVISGLHITFIGGLTLLLIRVFTNKKLSQFIFASLFLWSYSLAVGANVPVVRAAIMFTILLFSQAIYRHGTLLNALGLSILIILVWRPSDVFTPSFQLTFASVGAIVLTAFPLIEKLRSIGVWSPSNDAPFPPKVPVWLKRFCETLYWRERAWEIKVSRELWAARLFKRPHLKWLEAKNLQYFPRYIFEAILVSVTVQIWLLPLSIIYFHRLSVLSVFLNLWVGIIIALESFAAIFAVFLLNISGALALPFVGITEGLNWLLVSAPYLLTENSWASLRIPNYAGAMKAVYILYFAPVFVLTAALNSWKPFELNRAFKTANLKLIFKLSGVSILIFICLIIFHPLSAPTADGRLRVDFLDVGQGDAALITFPDGETLLVDGGGKTSFNRDFVQNGDAGEPEIFEPDTPSIGEMVVSKFLWEKGYSKVDYILATHADADHIQGLSDIAENFRVKAAIFGRTPMKNAEFAKLHAILQKHEIQSVTLSRGDVLTFGAVKIEILYPGKDENAEAASDNNNSLVLRLIYGERKFLLTGDIEKETENELSSAPESLETDVIKVAHHGSRTSSTAGFINRSKAKLAVVSVGRDSPFGHPHTEVVERWKAANAKILTTGENGTISVSTDGKDLQLRTFGKEKIYR